MRMGKAQSASMATLHIQLQPFLLIHTSGEATVILPVEVLQAVALAYSLGCNNASFIGQTIN